MELLIDAIALILFLAISAFFSASEVAFLSISNIRMHSLLEKKVPGAEKLEQLKKQRRKVIISMLIGSNISNIAASAIATTVALSLFGDAGLGISVGVMSFLILTFGDIAPKSFATTYGERMILKVAPIIEIFYKISWPLVMTFEFINMLIPGMYSRPTGVEKFSEEEVRAAINLGAQHHSISEREKQMMENVLVFEDKNVDQVMTPRAKVVVFPAGMSIVDAHRKAIESTHSRFPVIKDGKIIGIAGMRALSKAIYEKVNAKVEDITIDPVHIRSGERLHKAFACLQDLGRHMAIVVNEKDEFVGILTLEDLFEELVGKLGK